MSITPGVGDHLGSAYLCQGVGSSSVSVDAVNWRCQGTSVGLGDDRNMLRGRLRKLCRKFSPWIACVNDSVWLHAERLSEGVCRVLCSGPNINDFERPAENLSRSSS